MSANNRSWKITERGKKIQKAKQNKKHDWQWSKKQKTKIDLCGLEKDWKSGCETNETSWRVLLLCLGQQNCACAAILSWVKTAITLQFYLFVVFNCTSQYTLSKAGFSLYSNIELNSYFMQNTSKNGHIAWYGLQDYLYLSNPHSFYSLSLS